MELHEGLVPSAASSGSGLTPEGRRMLEAIDDLPEDEREAFSLVRIQGLTQVEAAEVLGVSMKTVQRRVESRVADSGGGVGRPPAGGRATASTVAFGAGSFRHLAGEDDGTDSWRPPRCRATHE